MKDRGYFAIYRSLINSELWLSEPFTRGQAWIDLIGLANHKDGFFRKRGNRINVKRGQLGWSIKRLSDRWQWSQGKVSRFLNELESDGQIVTKKTNLTSLISIVNYNEYQKNGEQIDAQTESRRRADGEQTETNKNVNNDKNENNDNFTEKENFNPDEIIDRLKSKFQMRFEPILMKYDRSGCTMPFRDVVIKALNHLDAEGKLDTISDSGIVSVISSFAMNQQNFERKFGTTPKHDYNGPGL